MTTPAELQTRFLVEYNSILSYINVTTLKMRITPGELEPVANHLSALGLLLIDGNAFKSSQASYIYTSDELQIISYAFRSVRPRVKELLENAPQFTLFSSASDENSRLFYMHNQAIDFLANTLERMDGSSEEIRSLITGQILVYAATEEGFFGLQKEHLGDDAQSTVSKIYDLALDHSKAVHRRKLKNILETIDLVDIVSDAVQSDTLLNIYRQAFILLMTVFDATMFDLMRLALTRDFFRLIGKVGDRDKSVLPKDLSAFQSLEQLRDSIIDDWLRNRYLKQILFFLKEQNVDCIDPTSQFNFGHLVELVLRRNVHIHNRGIVDSFYLSDVSKDGAGQYSYNMYNLSMNETTEIDAAYWVSAGQLCTACIDRVAAWVDSLPFLPASPPTGTGA